MIASFHSEGTVPSSSDKLNNFASGVLICSTISLSSFCCIPSTPGYLLCFIFLILFAIISGVTNNCHKCSDVLPSNLVNGTGSELISSLVKTELKYSFRTSANSVQPEALVTWVDFPGTLSMDKHLSLASVTTRT